VISSTVSSRASANVAAALAAGALDVLPKGDLDLRDPGAASAVELRRRIKVLSGARVIRHPRARLPARAARVPAPTRTVWAVGVCASTGGPQALVTMLRRLPGSHSVPVLVVQHIAAGFSAGFAAWLDQEIPLPVRMAEGGEPLARGVWIAPDGAHLLLSPDSTLALDRQTQSIHRPSGDLLFRSLAAVLGSESAAVVLTGMGRDGADGLGAVRAAGGLTIAQDEATSAVYGMPKAASPNAALILPPDAIGVQLAALRPVERAK
jgi:two-component system chemotaxis response regulator CheB